MAKKINKNSQLYWKKRMDEIFSHVDQMDYDFFYELQAIYSESAQQIQKEIFSFYTKYAEENEITYQEAKKRLMRKDLSDYRENAKKYLKQAEKDPELLKRLNEQYQAGKVTRLEALNLELTYQQGILSGKLHNSFEMYLKKVASYAYKKVSGGLSASTLNRPALEQLINMPWNGRNYSQAIWGNTDELAKDLKDVLKKGFISGKGPADMARELRKKYNVAKSRAETLVRTDGTNVINNATAKRYADAGLTEYQFHAHIDDRTTQICKDLNTEIFLLSDFQPGKNAPPMHYNCRSTIVPTDRELNGELKSDKENEKQKETVYNEVNDELRNQLEKDSDNWFNTLNPEGQKSVKKYTGSFYKSMNHTLRNPPKEIGFFDKETYSQINDFEKALSNFKLNHDIVTYRGISQAEYNQILDNSVFKDFKSTSVRKKVAQNFQEDRSEHKLVRFNIPKGTNGAYLGNHSEVDLEKEFTLNYGTKYTVKETKEGLEVTIVGREEK